MKLGVRVIYKNHGMQKKWMLNKK